MSDATPLTDAILFRLSGNIPNAALFQLKRMERRMERAERLGREALAMLESIKLECVPNARNTISAARMKLDQLRIPE